VSSKDELITVMELVDSSAVTSCRICAAWGTSGFGPWISKPLEEMVSTLRDVENIVADLNL